MCQCVGLPCCFGPEDSWLTRLSSIDYIATSDREGNQKAGTTKRAGSVLTSGLIPFATKQCKQRWTPVWRECAPGILAAADPWVARCLSCELRSALACGSIMGFMEGELWYCWVVVTNAASRVTFAAQNNYGNSSGKHASKKLSS